MTTIGNVALVLEEFAPPDLAEEWDNVGLLVGDRAARVSRVMTCLTITETTVNEAVDGQAELIVTHHPLPFRPINRLTTDTVEGRLLLQLISAQIAVISPHTAFDSSRAGINQHLAMSLGLRDIAPLVPAPGRDDAELGSGRFGTLPGDEPLSEMVVRVRAAIPVETIRVVGRDNQPVGKVGIACGSGGSLLEMALANGCDCFLTGEISFHSALAAEGAGAAVILAGHFASERFALDLLAEFLGEQLPGVEVWASRHERDPIRTR